MLCLKLDFFSFSRRRFRSLLSFILISRKRKKGGFLFSFSFIIIIIIIIIVFLLFLLFLLLLKRPVYVLFCRFFSAFLDHESRFSLLFRALFSAFSCWKSRFSGAYVGVPLSLICRISVVESTLRESRDVD